MAGRESPIPTLVWLGHDQAEVVRAVAGRTGLRVVEAGSPTDPGPASVSPLGFDDAQPFTDLRQALATTSASLVLLARGLHAAPDEGSAGMEPSELIRLCRARRLRELTWEPLFAGLSEPSPADDADAFVRFIPYFSESRAFGAARDVLIAFGPARTLSVALRCGRGQGSVAARLLDAMQLVHSLLGSPDSIDAAAVTRVAPSGVHMAPAESLAALRGDLTANLRFAGARAASISLSDRAGRWFRGVSVIGERGCIRLDESGFEHIDPSGAVVDHSTIRGKKAETPARVDAGAVSAFADQISRALDPHVPRPEPFDTGAVMAMCEAALLSARTGQPESPATVLRMAMAN